MAVTCLYVCIFRAEELNIWVEQRYKWKTSTLRNAAECLFVEDVIEAERIQSGLNSAGEAGH